MRILFAASPGIAVPALEELFRLHRSSPDIELAAILTNPDRPKGRSAAPQPTDIAEAAAGLSARIADSAMLAGSGKQAPAVLKPEKLDSAARELVAQLKPDLLVSFAYGGIFGPKFLDLFPLGGINIHPSLLPKFRGPAPIPAVILAREKETGLTIQRLALEIDCGDILMQERVPLNGRETSASLSKIMAEKAAECLAFVLEGFVSGALREGLPQNHNEATYCPLIGKENGLLDWNKKAVEIDAMIRAYDPWPQSWTMHGDKQLFILKAEYMGNDADFSMDTQAAVSKSFPAQAGAVLGIDKRQGILVQTGEGLLALRELQYRGKKALKWDIFLHGARNFIGSRLG